MVPEIELHGQAIETIEKPDGFIPTIWQQAQALAPVRHLTKDGSYFGPGSPQARYKSARRGSDHSLFGRTKIRSGGKVLGGLPCRHSCPYRFEAKNCAARTMPVQHGLMAPS